MSRAEAARYRARQRAREDTERLLATLAVEERVRVEALVWARNMLLDLRDRAALDPGDRQVREDATLVATAADELVTGREPRSVTGQIGRVTRIPTPAEGALLREIWHLRSQIPRAPSTGCRQPWEVSLVDVVALGLRPITARRGSRRREQEAEEAWQDLCRLAELTDQEAEALRLHKGLGWSLRDTAQALGVPPGRIEALVKRSMGKLEAYIMSREWTLETFLRDR